MQGVVPGSQVTTLVERLRPVVSRRAGAALGVWGEPGSGKSFQVREALASTACRSVTVAATVSLRQWRRALPYVQRLPGWALRTLEDLEQGEIPPVADVVAALGALLAAAAPFVLHLEDLPSADQQRRALVVQLGSLAQRTRGVGLIVTSRAPSPEPLVPLHVTPLTAEAAKELLEAQAGGALPPDAAAWIYRRAAGNPLYTIEYFRYLTRLGHLWNDGQRWRWRPADDALMPTSIEGLIGRRLAEARSGDVDTRVLEALAYLGPKPAAALLAAVAGVSPTDLAAALARLEQAGVVIDGGFAHPLFAEHGLKRLGSGERRALARRAIAALGHTPVEAARFVADAELTREEALSLLRTAAAQSDDAVKAARFQAAAVRYAEGDELVELATSAAAVLQHHDLPEAGAVMALAMEVPGVAQAIVTNYAHLLARSGRQAEADDLAQRLIDDDGTGVAAASVHLTSRNVAGDHMAAWTIWEDNPALRRSAGSELLRAATASALATGHMTEARSLIEAGLAAADSVELRCEFLSLQALLALHSGDAKRADELIAGALELLLELDAPRLRATALLNRGAILRMLGDYQGMGACLEECMNIRSRAGDGPANAFAAAALAELRIEQARYEEAAELLDQAIGTLELFPAGRYLINARSMACSLGLAQATPMSRLAALQQAETGLQGARDLGNPRVIRELLFDASLANAAVGDAARAEALAQESLTLAATAGDSPTDKYRTSWSLGLALEGGGDLAGAERHLTEALELASQVENAIDTHKIGLELARLRVDRGAIDKHRRWFAERGLLNGVAIADRHAGLTGTLRSGVADRPPRLEVLGPMRLAGEDLVAVRGEKRKGLLALLLEARVSGRSGVAKLAIIDALYPDQDELRASSSLKELVHGVRSAYGADLVLTTPDGYALGNCDSDFERFMAEPDAALWRGLYLDGLEFDGSVRDTLYLALARHARDLVASDPRTASRLARILIEAEPYRVDYLTTGLEAYRAAGNHRSLERVYQSARARLAELGETLPRRWQMFLTNQ